VGISNKQKKYIELNRTKYSHQKLADDLSLDPAEVKEYLDANPPVKTPFYFYLIMIFIPVFFFVLLEVGLRVFNYGYDFSMWGEVIEGKYILNPDAPRRYFTTVKSVPASIEDIFDKEKVPNSFRVFILGESSAAGYPYMPMGAFSRYLRRRLELSYPDKKIEVINIGLSAISSYTVRDFVPEVLDQRPDLILIYTGHNEYYGALGVGSQESVSNSRALVNMLLYMNRFKTTQLVKDFIQWFVGIVGINDEGPATGTLMSRMAKEKEIELNSEQFNVGINQFEGNLTDIIEMIQNQNVPLIISTLASNLKGQAPFISINKGDNPSANQIFSEAEKEYSAGNYKKANSLYRYAKDLDGLRFRAPEKMNSIILSLANKYKVPTIDADSMFSAMSNEGIIGNDWMTDHLHPNLAGYQKMGKLFYEKMHQVNYLPANSTAAIPFEEQDRATLNNFVYSNFDSVVADYRIKLLKNDWPFIDPKLKKSYWEVCIPKDYIDSAAVHFLLGDLSWGKAIEKVADKSLRRDDIILFTQHMRALIYQYPIVVEYYRKIENITLILLQRKEYNKAKIILNMEYELSPNAFSTKWLGQIALQNGNTEEAIKFLEKSLFYNPEDEQVLYNLSGAYALNKDYKKAYQSVTKLIENNPNHQGAKNLLNQLKGILN
jgi:lysophospholipase L1-like esterase